MMRKDIITPSDISGVKFSVSWRGYNPHEIDEFIQQIQREYIRLWQENKELTNQTEFLRKEKATKKTEKIKINTQKNISNLIQQIDKLREIRNEMIIETKNYLTLLISKLDYIEKIFNVKDNLPVFIDLPALKVESEKEV